MDSVLKITVIGFICSGGIILLIMKLIQVKYHRRVKKDEEFLRNCMEMLVAQYAAMHEQMEWMEEQRGLLSEQIKELNFWKHEGEDNQQKQINTYLQQLRSRFSEIQTGIYCDDWIVDAVLSRKKEEASRQSIDIQISMQQYQLGRIAEITAAMILSSIIEYGMLIMRKKQEKGVIKLDIGTVRHQFYIYCDFKGTGQDWGFKRKLMELVQPYDGIIKITKKNGMTLVTTMIGL